MPTSEIIEWVIIVSVFALVLALWLMIVAAWSGRRMSVIQRMQERLGLRSKEGKTEDGRVLRLWKDGKETTTAVGGIQTASLYARLEDLRLTAGWVMPLRTIFLAILGVSMLVTVTGLVFTRSPLALLLSLVVPGVFWTLTNMRIKRRNIQLEGQFVEALELAARSLKAGHPLVGSFRLISEEMSPPVSLIFAEICQLQEYGAGLKEAIQQATTKAGSGDMKLFATSVAIQLDSGGNLAEMMHRLAYVIRDRIRLRRRVGILTAQTQLSKRVLIVLPFVLLAVEVGKAGHDHTGWPCRDVVRAPSAIPVRFPLTQQVQVGAIEYENSGHCRSESWYSFNITLKECLQQYAGEPGVKICPSQRIMSAIQYRIAEDSSKFVTKTLNQRCQGSLKAGIRGVPADPGGPVHPGASSV